MLISSETSIGIGIPKTSYEAFIFKTTVKGYSPVLVGVPMIEKQPKLPPSKEQFPELHS